MAYDQGLAARCSEVLQNHPAIEEKKMFGGIGYLLNGNMACGVLNDKLIVRVGAAAFERAMAHPDTAPFDITDRSMKGWIMVKPEGLEEDENLQAWVKTGLTLAETLPAK